MSSYTKNIVFVSLGILLSFSLCKAAEKAETEAEENVESQLHQLRNEFYYSQDSIASACKKNKTLLIYAVMKKKKDSLIKFLINPVSVREINSEGDSALGWATLYYSDEVVDKLLKAGSDINLQNRYGDTPIMDVHRGMEIDEAFLRVKLLLQNKADVGIINNKEQTIVDALKQKYDKEFVQLTQFRYEIDSGYLSGDESGLRNNADKDSLKIDKIKALLDFLKLELHQNKKLRIEVINDCLGETMSAPLVRLIVGYVFPKPKEDN